MTDDAAPARSDDAPTDGGTTDGTGETTAGGAAGPVRAVLTDAFERVADQVAETAAGLSAEDGRWRPDPGANTVAWLLWHLARVQDDHVSELAGRSQVWVEQGFERRFGLPFAPEATGYGQSSDDVGRVDVGGDDLAAYHAAVHAATLDYLATLTTDELARVVDEDWDPPVTAAARLVSVVNDCTMHVGQAAYVRGMLGRRP